MSTKTTEANSKGWIPDSKAETVLKELGMKYTITSIPITAIDWKTAEKNPARSERSIDEDMVEDYTLAMKNGADFPYPIMIQKGNHFYPPAGMHRTLSAKKPDVK